MTMAAAGFYYCALCPMGTFQILTGSISSQDCIPCDEGKVALSQGSSSCTTCPSGSMPPYHDPTTCIPCPAGSFSAGGMPSCLPCPPGTFASDQGADHCAVCPQGTYQPLKSGGGSSCQPCPPGTISDGSDGLSCLSCNYWPGTFASGSGQTICLRRQTACRMMYFVNVSTDPAMDNHCARCEGCSADELAIAYESPTQSLGLLSPDQISSHINQLCPGNTEAPLYRCISNAPVPGQYLSITQAVGAAVGSSGIDPYTFQTCSDLLFDGLTVQWVAGPSIQTCYVGCLYGISTQGVLDYQKAFQNQPQVYPENAGGNQFLQRMLQYKGLVCTPCPNSACPLGRYRPDFGHGCGPPCALQPCDTPTGCTGVCSNAPPNAGYIGGGPVLGSNWCPWSCLLGWHLADNRSACLPCKIFAPMVPLLCNSSNYALVSPQTCMPWHTSLDLCKYCPPLPYSKLVGWNQTCQYQCYSGYYLNNSFNESGLLVQKCLPCSTVWLYNWTLCPVGMFLDESQCYARGVAPQCQPCLPPPPSVALVTNGGRNASQCRGICDQGFHTVSASSGNYWALGDPSRAPFGYDVVCVQCRPDDRRSCFNSSTCFPGYFRNLSVGDGQPLSCVPCTQSLHCPPGFYAPICTGRNFTDAPCLPCDPGLLANQQFVDYSAALQGPNRERVTQGDCPRACVNNYVQAQEDPTKCVSCRSLAFAAASVVLDNLECIQQGVQPQLCAFVYSYWNAGPGAPWWDAAHSPPFLGPYSTQPINRAGLCWACPIGTATLQDSQDLCVTLPGYTSQPLLPSAKLPIPSLPSDVYLVMQRPRMPIIELKPQRRRLLTVTGTPPAASSLSLVPVACPYGSYKAGNGDGICYACPQGSSTIGQASVSLAACMCQYGYYLRSNLGPCEPCPQDTYLNVSVSVVQKQANALSLPYKCTPCPNNQSTLGATGATSCACALGYMPSHATCVLCPPGYFCPPCTTADQTCPPEKVECFPDSTSPPGSYDVSNCTCKEGLILASRPHDPTQFYCMALPLGTQLNPKTLHIECLPGWKQISVGNCQLCPPGYYATINGPIGSPPQCWLCPADTYNPTVSAIQACTPCPAQQVTLGLLGSTSLDNCSCPPPTIKVPNGGGCLGCMLDQYVDPATGQCIVCPSHSVAQPGASSLADCLCSPGYQLEEPPRGCQLCPQGSYSSFATNVPCRTCPQGSTTAGMGATSITACGASADLCLEGYRWRLGVGCFSPDA